MDIDQKWYTLLVLLAGLEFIRHFLGDEPGTPDLRVRPAAKQAVYGGAFSKPIIGSWLARILHSCYNKMQNKGLK